MSRARIALAAAAFSLTACTFSVPVAIDRELSIAGPGGTPTSFVQDVDLSSESELWDHRDNVSGLTIHFVRVEVESTGAGHTAQHAHVVLAFRPDGAPATGEADVVIGTFDTSTFAAGTVIEAAGTSAADGVLRQALEGSGRFSLVLTADADGVVDAVVKLSVDGSLDFKVP